MPKGAPTRNRSRARQRRRRTRAAGTPPPSPSRLPVSAVRNAALTLVEATNLLVIDGRRVGAQDFPAEADGALDSAHIDALIAARRPAFNAFAVALRQAGLAAIAAIDAKDPALLVKAGGDIDEVCEACHVAFWYPNQVIPAFPGENDPHRPIFRAGSRLK